MNLSKEIHEILFVVIFIVFLLVGWVFFHYFFKVPTQAILVPVVVSTVIPPEIEKINSGLPIRIKIPNIKVDALVEQVGLTQGGAMGVPEGPADVGWFNLGPRPGDIGSAVIAGHFGWSNNIPAVFDNLHKLNKGDKIYIEDDKGVTISFIVRESKRYDANADASDVFNSSDEKAHLNLITCEGIWDIVSKGRPYRLIIFADKEIN
ncbi:MAG: class F sortase [Candidatus Paceibacterota bacterium]|jgi:LPXTG-site transpeptidase (sortase) family protein